MFGDMFGTVNSLFAGLAFAGVIYTIFLQRNELALQRNELVLTREQLARSAAAQEKSHEALAEQVEALRMTAKLNALSGLIGHYDVKISAERNVTGKGILKNQQQAYIGQLETELRSIHI